MLGLGLYNPGSPEGVFEGDAERYMSQLVQQIGRQFEDSERRLGNAQGVMLTIPKARYGTEEDVLMSVQDYLEDLSGEQRSQIPSGICAWFEGTWAEARALDGWVIRDGSNGTTDMVSDERFIRSVGSGENSGTKGGCGTHRHGIPNNNQTEAVCNAGGSLCVASAGHCHCAYTQYRACAPLNIANIPVMKL